MPPCSVDRDEWSDRIHVWLVCVKHRGPPSFTLSPPASWNVGETYWIIRMNHGSAMRKQGTLVCFQSDHKGFLLIHILSLSGQLPHYPDTGSKFNQNGWVSNSHRRLQSTQIRKSHQPSLSCSPGSAPVQQKRESTPFSLPALSSTKSCPAEQHSLRRVSTAPSLTLVDTRDSSKGNR